MSILYFAIENALIVLTVERGDCRCDLHLTERSVQCVAPDPLRPQFVYCGTFDSGLWRSDNAGQSWQPAGDGIRYSRVLSVAVSQSERVNGSGVVYAGTEPSAVFRSEDAGKTWQECTGLGSLP